MPPAYECGTASLQSVPPWEKAPVSLEYGFDANRKTCVE
jgi:hypothetical protein